MTIRKPRLVNVDPGPLALLAEILRDHVDLPGAACASRAPLFDEHRDDETTEARNDRLTVAAGICRTCPVVAACHTAVSELPHPTGIWAGQLHQRGDALRNRKKAS